MSSYALERPDPRDVDDTYLTCTVTHFHALRFQGRYSAPSGQRIIKWRCVNCTTIATDVYSARGRRVGRRHYDRPKDYPEVKPDREAAIIEFIRRQPVQGR